MPLQKHLSAQPTNTNVVLMSATGEINLNIIIHTSNNKPTRKKTAMSGILKPIYKIVT